MPPRETSTSGMGERPDSTSQRITNMIGKWITDRIALVTTLISGTMKPRRSTGYRRRG